MKFGKTCGRDGISIEVQKSLGESRVVQLTNSLMLHLKNVRCLRHEYKNKEYIQLHKLYENQTQESYYEIMGKSDRVQAEDDYKSVRKLIWFYAREIYYGSHLSLKQINGIILREEERSLHYIY